MSGERSAYTPEFKDEAVRVVIESGRAIAQVARELRINDGTLGNWVARYRDEHPVSESPLSVSERARLAELERENRQLRLDNEFLGKAAAISARQRNAASRVAAGVLNARVSRGRVLSLAAIASSWGWRSWERSVPLGRYWRRSPLVFSFEPRCQGL